MPAKSFPPARVALILSLLLTTACGIGENAIGLDAGGTPSVDGGFDAGRADAGSEDAGVDAGSDDAGIDAGSDDAGIDAGSDDAGVDAGSDDAGVDAGSADAGSCDPASCNDNDPCTADSCSASGCTHTLATGPVCDDHNECTTVDVCIEGLCVGTEPVVCPTPGVCEEQGVCNPITGHCSQPFSDLGTSCDDGSLSTYNDACDGNGVCAGVTVFCPVGTTCLTYAPNGTAACTPTLLDAVPCDDGDACTQTDTCDVGLCVGSNPVTCEAHGVCEEQGTCDSASGQCSHPHTPQGTTCDDESLSTYDDACDGNGVCAGVTVFCPTSTACLTYAPNGTATCTPTVLDAVPCDDGDACTQTDACEMGLCVGSNTVICGTPGMCEEQGTCDHASGQCSHPHAPQGTTCDDDSLATYNDRCDNYGVCGGTAVVCPTDTPCVTYAPNGFNTCTATFHDGASCDDNNACTLTDSCQQGSCIGSNPVACAAPPICHTQGTCDPETGICSAPGILNGTACDDGSVSTYDDTCDSAGTCVGNSVTCPADDVCTSWAPNGTSNCTPTYHDDTPCNDADPCTSAGACHQGSCQLPTPVVCDSAHQCSDGACVCPAGWTGSDCTTDVDECTENPNICGGGSTCTNTAGSYTCHCITNYTSPTGANCVSSIAAVELVIFYDDTVQQVFGAQTEARLAEIFTKTKDIYDSSFPSQPLTLALNAMVRLSPLPSSIVKRACNTPDPTQPSCTGCWVNSTPADCSGPLSQSATEIDVQTLLSKFITYTHTTRANAIQSLSGGMDVPVFLTADDFASSVIGLGSIGAACNSYSGLVVQVLPTDTLETGLTLAHELGHNLNMSHDPYGSPYIMAPSLNTAYTTFSPASVSSYTNWRSTLGARNCISDPAQDDWRSHTCGNGKIDPGETCDPGVEPDSCCDSTCHLKPGCVCGNTELCCSNGQPKDAGTVCRATAGECDVVDTCDGLSGSCLDLYKAPGTTCSNNGLCLNKQCASRNLQCSTINDGYYPNSTACATTTDCSKLACNVNFTCDVTWLAAPDDGSSCGAGKQCSKGACVSSSQLANYAWAPGAWSECSNGLSTRTLSCVDEIGTPASSSACDPGLAPATSRSCTP